MNFITYCFVDCPINMNSLKKILVSYFLVLVCSFGLSAQTFIESKAKGDDLFKRKSGRVPFNNINMLLHLPLAMLIAQSRLVFANKK